MSGNLCRCGAYVSIVQAVTRAAATVQAAQAASTEQDPEQGKEAAA
jgi:xanthine dehydrogenase YagT iron-sulfur-binding subunit